MDVKSANTLCFLCGKYAKVYKLANLEDKIKNWEEGKEWGWFDALKTAEEARREDLETEIKRVQKDLAASESTNLSVEQFLNLSKSAGTSS